MGKAFDYLFLLSYPFLFFAAIIGAWLIVIGSRSPIQANPPITADEWKSFASTATIGITAISAIMSAILSIRNLLAQAETSKNIEKVKKVIDKRIPAHGDLYAAAKNYYRILSPLETGDFSFSEVEKAETKMKEVEGLTVYVSKIYESEWNSFWQQARYIKEQVHKNIPESQKRKDFWRSNVKELGGYVNSLQKLAREEFNQKN